MSAWSHAICAPCWEERFPDLTPYVLAIPDLELCCFCGEDTEAGIYIRDDPQAVPHPKGCTTEKGDGDAPAR